MLATVKTFGCQMNTADSEVAMGVLDRSNLGVQFTEDDEAADLFLINTCSVREHAEDRVYGLLGRLRKRKAEKPELIVGVIGCMVGEHQGKLIDRFPHIDFVCTQRDIDNIPTYVADALENKKCVSVVKTGLGSKNTKHALREEGVRAFVNITHGCDNHCSYCIVPYVRGREISRPMRDILNEVKFLKDQGFKQIMFLGQNVNSYGKGLPKNENFVNLLAETSKINGVELIEFMTPHPHDVSFDLIDLLGANPKISKHLHFPVQAGSNRMLEKMRRDYTREEYLGKVARLKEKVKNVSITTDIIVGFHDETEKDFEETLSLIKEVEFDSSFIFKYSPRQKTFAYKWEDNIPQAVKEERNQRALSLQREISKKRNESYVGLEMRALISKESKKNKNEFLAVTWNDKLAILTKNNEKPGDIVRIKLTELVDKTNTFRAEIQETELASAV